MTKVLVYVKISIDKIFDTSCNEIELMKKKWKTNEKRFHVIPMIDSVISMEESDRLCPPMIDDSANKRNVIS